jgi:uroporphyrin-III C-methyltransferase/precorrin-2 dehydrogenase/sirohydrochlorin ferrochelatase
VLSGREQVAVSALERALEGAGEVPQGMVYLVGGGPGNPDLLTLRALRVMQNVDVVLYDHLVAPAIVDLARRDAERIYVGKERDNHAIRQDALNEMMVKLAREGKRVLRLKGGDPFVFGRGGEEIETLAAHGIPFEVVPGITAATGAAAYAGIPLTHREHAQSCVFVTGHLKDGSLDLAWDVLARPRQTLAIYMGVRGLPLICAKLIEHGLGAETPAAVVEKATLPKQRVVAGTLATLPPLVESEGIKPPALLIVGEVVRLRGKLGWYTPAAIEAGVPADSSTLGTPR